MALSGTVEFQGARLSLPVVAIGSLGWPQIVAYALIWGRRRRPDGHHYRIDSLPASRRCSSGTARAAWHVTNRDPIVWLAGGPRFGNLRLWRQDVLTSPRTRAGASVT